MGLSAGVDRCARPLRCVAALSRLGVVQGTLQSLGGTAAAQLALSAGSRLSLTDPRMLDVRLGRDGLEHGGGGVGGVTGGGSGLLLEVKGEEAGEVGRGGLNHVTGSLAERQGEPRVHCPRKEPMCRE